MDDFKQSLVASEGEDGPSLSYEGDARLLPSVAKKKRRTKPLFECVEPSRQVRGFSKDPLYKEAYDAMASDARTLPLQVLREKYPTEANSHRGARGRRKSRGIAFDPRLKDLRNWLIHLGPKPSAEHSAERKRRYEGYAPGNIEWLGSQGQTDNRCNTNWIEDVDGERLTIARFCNKHAIDYERNRKRFRRGWTPERILEAEDKSVITGDPLADWRPQSHVFSHYRSQYDKRKKRGQIFIDWLIEHLGSLQRKAKDAGLADQVFSLGIQISSFKVERRNLKAKRDAVLYCQIQDELSLLSSAPPKNNPLPRLSPTDSAEAVTQPRATACTVVRLDKSEAPEALPEHLLEMLRGFGIGKFGSGRQP